jgi:hypothetical protein
MQHESVVITWGEVTTVWLTPGIAIFLFLV